MENGKCNMGNGPFVGYSAKSLVLFSALFRKGRKYCEYCKKMKHFIHLKLTHIKFGLCLLERRKIKAVAQAFK